MFRKLILAAAIVLLPQCVNASVKGDLNNIPQEPAAYTILCVPDGYAADPASQDVIGAFSTDPTLVSLREATQMTTYTASDPDFRHRIAKVDEDGNSKLPEVTRDGKPTLLIVQDGQLLYGRAGATSAELADDISSQGVLNSINHNAGRCPIFRPCPSCPKEEPKKEVPETREPLRPILSPIAKEVPKVLPPPAPAAQLGLIALVFAAMTPATLLISAGSYVVTRKIQENQEQE